MHARSVPDLTAADVARLVGKEIGRQPRIVSVPANIMRHIATVAGNPDLASKICEPMLVSDDETRRALGLQRAHVTGPRCADVKLWSVPPLS